MKKLIQSLFKRKKKEIKFSYSVLSCGHESKFYPLYSTNENKTRWCFLDGTYGGQISFPTKAQALNYIEDYMQSQRGRHRMLRYSITELGHYNIPSGEVKEYYWQ